MISVTSIEHLIAIGAQKLVSDVRAAAGFLAKILPKIQATEPVVEEITEMLDPSQIAVNIERAGYASLGKLAPVLKPLLDALAGNATGTVTASITMPIEDAHAIVQAGTAAAASVGVNLSAGPSPAATQ